MSSRKHKIMKVGPEVAAAWLEKNTHNRDLRQRTVDAYAAAMKRGEWKLTPEPIAFCHPWTDSQGNHHPETLIEGQHRLWAVVTSGVEVEFTVWWGCAPYEFDVIGQGIVRTQGDVLQITRRDIKHPTVVARVISTARHRLFGRGTKIMTWETDLFLTNFQTEIEAVAEFKRKLGPKLLSNMIPALFAAYMIDPIKTTTAVDRLDSAVGFTERDPMRALHMYVADQRATKTLDSDHTQFGKALCAFLAEIDGRSIKNLRSDISYLGDARTRLKSRIDGVAKAMNAGKLPVNFYDPRDYEGAAQEKAA